MPLITCPDCGNSVSTQAPVCPKCGRPIAAQQATPQITRDQITSSQTGVRRRGCIIAAVTGGIFIVLFIVFTFIIGIVTLATEEGNEEISRDEQARRVVNQYLEEQKKGEIGNSERFWCHPEAVPDAFANLIDYEIDATYYHQVHEEPTSPPNWYRFIVHMRGTNAFGGIVRTDREYYVRAMPDGSFKMFATCADDECKIFRVVYRMAVRLMRPELQAVCGFPEVIERNDTSPDGAQDGGDDPVLHDESGDYDGFINSDGEFEPY